MMYKHNQEVAAAKSGMNVKTIMVPKNWTTKIVKWDIISQQKNGNYMSKKAKQYSATEKIKIVLEPIKAEMTIV